VLEVRGAGAGAHVVAVPLAARDEVHGRVLAARAHEGFGEDEPATLRVAARLAGIHVGHARRLAAAEQTAVDLQPALVTEPGRPGSNLGIAGRYLPLGGRALMAVYAGAGHLPPSVFTGTGTGG
ncbi:hypothetical protein ACFXJJ_32385, partial [Streptomyces sp. NPDC059233]